MGEPEVWTEEGAAAALKLVPIERGTGIGASEVAAVLGLSKRRPIDVYLEKTGKVEPGLSAELEELFYWGKAHQPAILRRYRERAPRPTYSLVDFAGAYRAEAGPPHEICSPDAIDPVLRLAVEAKFVPFGAAKWGAALTDQVPPEYYFQVQWQMLVTGLGVADLVALFNGCRQAIFTVYRDGRVIEEIRSRVARFWEDHVVADVPPEVVDTQTVQRWLRQAFPRQIEPMRLPTVGEAETVQRYIEAQEVAAAATAAAEDLKAALKAAIGNAEGLELPEVFRVLYRADRDGERVDWEGLARTAVAGPQLEELVKEFTKKVQGKRPLRVTQLDREEA